MILSLAKLKRLFFPALMVWLALAAAMSIHLLVSLEAKSSGLPFGIFVLGKGLGLQDFSYNLLFLRGIEDHVAPRPYRLADQEKIARSILPRGDSAISHAYSPVALVLAWPLLAVSGGNAYVIYLLLCTALIALLFYCDLLPRMQTWRQLAAAAVAIGSVCLLATYELGQTAIFTTPLIGALWAIVRREGARGWLADMMLALLFWMLCFKPNVAVIPLMVLLAAQAWRALALGALLLAVTWLVMAPWYGGLITGLGDYAYLLNHYNNADFTPYFQRDYVPGHDAETRGWFAFDRAALLAVNLALLAGRWLGRLTASEQFQGTVWAFLLVSPYRLPSEDWIVCLLIVEGSFFRSGPLPLFVLKLVVLAGMLNLRAGVSSPFPFETEYPLKCLLFGWAVLEWWRERRRPVLALESAVD